MASKYVSPTINVDSLDKGFSRADIVFHDVDHSGASYEASVFLNNPNADEMTPKDSAQGYAGKFHIFGHGGCLGDDGHCDLPAAQRFYDPRPAHPLTPAKKIVIATEAVRRAIAQGSDVTVTVVPRVTASTSLTDTENVLKFERVAIVTYC